MQSVSFFCKSLCRNVVLDTDAHRLTLIGIFEPVGNNQENNALGEIKIRAIGAIRVLFCANRISLPLCTIARQKYSSTTTVTTGTLADGYRDSSSLCSIGMTGEGVLIMNYEHYSLTPFNSSAKR